jgi:peroxiredoxin
MPIVPISALLARPVAATNAWTWTTTETIAVLAMFVVAESLRAVLRATATYASEPTPIAPMQLLVTLLIGVLCLLGAMGGWLAWQLLCQNGPGSPSDDAPTSQPSTPDPRQERQSLATSASASRFSNRSLARSRINRDGLKAGTSAPNFRLPRADGRGELALDQWRGRHLLLVFSDPHCGPCQVLAPHLEKFHRENGARPASSPHQEGDRESSCPPQVVVISRGDPKENRAKIKELGLTFPVLLQGQWEISRLYAMFATPMAYWIDDQGVILNDVAVGVEPIRALMSTAMKSVNLLSQHNFR